MEFIKLREYPQLAKEAARWFHEKWNIPLEAYVCREENLYPNGT